MNRDKLIQELKQKDDLLPQDLLADSNPAQLADQLKTIFESEQAELQNNEKFKANFTEVVSYLYVLMLNVEPAKRDKNIFSDNLINFLLSPA